MEQYHIMKFRFIVAITVVVLAVTWGEAPVHAEDKVRGNIRERVRERIMDRRQNRQNDHAGSSNHEMIKIAGLDVAIWQPDPALSSLRPLIIFSHGFGGCATQSEFLMRALADHGYYVAAPNHDDAACGTKGQRQRPEKRFKQPDSWTDSTYIDRAEDIRALLDGLRQVKPFSIRIDWSRIGLSGHSLGGYTVLGLAGGWPSWTMPGIDAILALSPYCTPYTQKGDLEKINFPVMYQGGTRDRGITPYVKGENGCYAKTASPAYFVEFEKAGHFAWTNRQDASHQNIITYSLWFFDRYIKESEEPLPEGVAGVSNLVQK